MEKIRIMTFNVGYLTGITGYPAEYITKINRFIFPSRSGRGGVLKNLISLIEKEKPDILFLAEIRDESYMNSIKNLFAESHIDIKYGSGSLLNLLPFFRGNCNGVFSCKAFSVRKLFIKNGTKKLVYQIDVAENCSILFSHFALGAATRKKQFLEIEKIIKTKENVIVAGDFNIFKGTEELSELFKNTNVRLVNDPSDKTFPSHRPAHGIDVFLASPLIRATRIEVLRGVQISDHLPVIADFEF